ncbi:TFIIB-type zinc ribbon-containing protein [Methanobrevibacter sp.]|uniref:TFIIB-type zinc ribbon-containing protein n=1 Tax=Methanobrevibacter sp. TaxID=66852 RepID=UPI00388D7F36
MNNQRNLRKRPEKVSNVENNEKICPECESSNFSYDALTHEVTCKRCGTVIEENYIANGSGLGVYGPEDAGKIQHGAPSTPAIHDGGISTDIDGANRNISRKDWAKWYRLRKWNRKIRISGARQRSLAFALTEIDRKSSLLSLPRSVRERASLIYRKALDEKLIRGRTIDGVVSASIFIACREHNIPRTLDEIAEVSSSTRRDIGRVERFLTRKLNIKLAPTSPNDYIPRFASELEMSGEFESKAIQIINESRKEGLTVGKGPSGLAAAALYIASLLLGDRKSQKRIAEVAGVTEVTVRNRYREISECLDLGVAV